MVVGPGGKLKGKGNGGGQRQHKMDPRSIPSGGKKAKLENRGKRRGRIGAAQRGHLISERPHLGKITWGPLPQEEPRRQPKTRDRARRSGKERSEGGSATPYPGYLILDRKGDKGRRAYRRSKEKEGGPERPVHQGTKKGGQRLAGTSHSRDETEYFAEDRSGVLGRVAMERKRRKLMQTRGKKGKKSAHSVNATIQGSHGPRRRK